MVERLRELGREVEYVVFEDEGHGFTKRANQDKAHDRIVERGLVQFEGHALRERDRLG